MTLDIRGGLKNTSISSNRYVVIEELVSNAIDSYLIRKSTDNNIPDLSIEIELNYFPTSLFDDGKYDIKISCKDNGAGFADEQVSAFVTKDSTYKDYLNIQGLGKCKGAGRIQYFHFFRKFNLESSFVNAKGEKKNRRLNVDENVRQIKEDSFTTTEQNNNDNFETKISLSCLTDSAYNKFFSGADIRKEFSAESVYKYIYITFIQRFILLKSVIGNFNVSLKDNNEKTDILQINSQDLPEPKSVNRLPVVCQHGCDNLGLELNVTRYSLPAESFNNIEHEVALCANSASVKSIANNYLKHTSDRCRPINGNFELLLIECDYLDDKVNEQRDNFNIPLECSCNRDLEVGISMRDIIDSLEDYVFDILTPIDFDKASLISSVEEKFGITNAMIDQTKVKVRYTDTETSIARRVLKKYQDEIISDTSNIFDLKQELLCLDPRTQDFRDKVNMLSWKYTSTVKKMDMSNLSQLVVRRAAMLEVLNKAVSVMLECQSDVNGKNENEKIIHNVFFPTGKDSRDNIDHDIWILNEEYHYFKHIASDKPLSSISWGMSDKLFDSQIDIELEALFTKNNKDHRLKRPDIAIFNEEGSAIIIEFKAPDVEIQDHIPDLVQYARLIMSKSYGRITKVYGYLIGTTMDETRMPLNYTKFPSGLGYFNTSPVIEQTTRVPYGELYSEVLFYDQFVERASNRLKIYKEKLKIDI